MDMFFKLITVLLALSSFTTSQRVKSLKTIFAWKSLQFSFPSDVDRQNALNDGTYRPNAGTPIDVDVEYKPTGERRIFQTIPRFAAGIPYSLATVRFQNATQDPIIEAYPSYDWHRLSNSSCSGITSASRVKIDDCNHMWVIDSGVAAGVQVCPPQLLTFDLNDNQLIGRYQFPFYLYTPMQSNYLSVAVDILDPPPSGGCKQAKVYAADPKTASLVVYDLESNNAWKVEDRLMSPNPKWGNHSIAGTTFTLLDGIYTLSLSPRSPPGKERHLYFHALAEDTECSVPLQFLEIDPPPESSYSKVWEQLQPSAFRVIGRRGVQSTLEAMDSKGNLFTSTNDPLSIFAWNINAPYAFDSFQVVASDPKQLEFVSGMKVVRNPSGFEELWVFTSRFQRIITGTLDYGEVNFVASMCQTNILLEYGECKGFDHDNFINPRKLY